MSSFGRIFRITTFGESHGTSVGCVIDGVPPNLPLCADDIQIQLNRRRPGQSSITTKRNEKDKVQILSGTENGVTLGTPIGLQVLNEDQRKHDYASTDVAPRPGHADYTYHIKYGVKASSGGGRASARETIGRVAAGAVAEKWLNMEYNTAIVSWVSAVYYICLPTEVAAALEAIPPTREDVEAIGTIYKLTDGTLMDKTGVRYDMKTGDVLSGEDKFDESLIEERIPTRCPHTSTAAKMVSMISSMRDSGDSVGGIVTTVVKRVPVGLGEPCFDKLEAELAKAMMSLPATKGFEVGEGFDAINFTGSRHNDLFSPYTHTEMKKENQGQQNLLSTCTNHAGGTLGGISSGQNLVFRVAVKPVSSISIPQETCTYTGQPTTQVVKGRHDPCVLPRVPPLTESMTALVLTDMAMLQRARMGVPLVTLEL